MIARIHRNSCECKLHLLEEKGGGLFSMFQRGKVEYIEPDLPYMGPPLKYLKVVERMKVAKPVTRKLLENAGRRVADSIQEGATGSL